MKSVQQCLLLLKQCLPGSWNGPGVAGNAMPDFTPLEVAARGIQ
jgi:hypothetical protein